MNEYYGYQQNDYRNYLMHYGKGQKAKNHKYIDIVDGRYIYPEDKGSKSKIDTTKSQKKVNSNYGYHIRAKQINAYLRKQDSNFATVNGESASNTIRKTPFKKAARKSNKLNSNSTNESNKKLNQKRLGLRSYLAKDKAKGLISNSKSSRFDYLLNKFKSSKSKVSKTLDTSLQKTKYSLSRAKKTLAKPVRKLRNYVNLVKSRADLYQRYISGGASNPHAFVNDLVKEGRLSTRNYSDNRYARTSKAKNRNGRITRSAGKANPF